jgi:hypothetical protein
LISFDPSDEDELRKINIEGTANILNCCIDFGGYLYATNSEINGLTMGAVGRGTTFDYVQVSHTNDDAFEWF